VPFASPTAAGELRGRSPISREIGGRGVLESLPRGFQILVFDLDLRFIHVIGDALRRAGWTDEAILGRGADELLSGDADGGALLRAYRDALLGKRSRMLLNRRYSAWQIDVGPLHAAGGPIAGGLVIGQDMSARQQAARLHEARARAAGLIATASNDLPQRLVSEVAPVLACVAAAYWRAQPGEPLSLAGRWARSSMTPAPAAFKGSPREDGPPSPSALVEAAFATGADQDALPGLFNRRRFEPELHRLAAAATRYGRSGAVIMLDLDDFKAVNDRYGHAVGDELLRQVADGLRRRLRASDIAARVGGDEFAVVLDNADPATAIRVAAEVAHDVAATRMPDRPEVHPSASVGVSPLASDAMAALDAADQAMYRDKRRHT
jgi:diguanylate cyclase (GGDEF)-like protein